MTKPRIGVYGLTGCAGDQLVIVNCEDELLAILSAVEMKSFYMAQTNADETELDVAFVEGSVSCEEDEHLLKDVRKRAGLLVAIGTCAVCGGVQASINNVDRKKCLETVYGQGAPEFAKHNPLPIDKVVPVDLYIPGCPIEKDQILTAVSSLLHGDLPVLPQHSVCFECKFKENVCLLKDKGEMCLGPLTVAGCGARCPSHNVPCRGCRGPVSEANAASEAAILKEKGYTDEDVARAMRNFAYDAIEERRAAGERR